MLLVGVHENRTTESDKRWCAVSGLQETHSKGVLDVLSGIPFVLVGFRTFSGICETMIKAALV